SGAGAVASLAGCLGSRFGTSDRTIDADALAEVVSGDAPTVPETLPVDIRPSFIDRQRSIAESDLSAVPAPFDRGEVPNGVIRTRLNDAFESATDSIDRIDEAETPYTRLTRANTARSRAHYVWAAWQAITGSLSREDLDGAIPAIEDAIAEFTARWSYVGDDPVRAVVVHHEIETEIRGARNWITSRGRRPPRNSGTALAVADRAEDNERARTNVDVASYVFDRFDRLDEPTDQRSRFEDVRERLRDRLRDQRASLPTRTVEDPTTLIDRDVGETAGVRAVADLGSEARYRTTAALEPDDSPSLARDIHGAANAVVYARAFDSLRARIEGGDDISVESAADVAALRTAAIDAVETARDTDRGTPLVRAMLPRYTSGMARTDTRLERQSGDVSVQSIAVDAIEYVVAAAICRALVPVCETAGTLLLDS
ncbi:hypothetical protein ACFQDD_10615, partial [Halorubrum pallidum]